MKSSPLSLRQRTPDVGSADACPASATAGRVEGTLVYLRG
jgi:hypothetical protein